MTNNAELYEHDFYEWTQRTAELLRRYARKSMTRFAKYPLAPPTTR